MTAVARAPVPFQPSEVDAPVFNPRVVLHNVSWDSYVAIGNALLDYLRLRMTFDGSNLEIMTTSSEHEVYKKWIAKLIETIAEEMDLPMFTAGNMTSQRADLEKGLEPDDCFWVAHERQLRGKRTWDVAREPPPDLVLEIEVSRSALDRMNLYARLRIPEVWCFDGKELRVYHLKPDSTFQLADHSLSFPRLPLEGVTPYLEPSLTVDYFSQVREFREWLRSLANR